MRISGDFRKIKMSILNVGFFSAVCMAFGIYDAHAFLNVSCTTSTVSTACATFATAACAGGSFACGSFTYSGTTYTNKCYCMSCGSGITTQLKSTDGKILGCGCAKSNCTPSNSTNSSTHLVTTSYSSSSSAYCLPSITSSSPTKLSAYCSGLAKTYSCASGYGAAATSITSTTKCYSCTGGLYFSTLTPKTTPVTFAGTNCSNPSTNLIGNSMFKAGNLNTGSFTGSAPTVSTSYCTPCTSTCYYASKNVTKDSSGNCIGIILKGCPDTYGSTACSTSGTGCEHAKKSGASCVCEAGYYGTAANSCSECPTHSTGKQTSAAGSDAETDCYLPSGTSTSDSTGEYDAEASCPYAS